MLGERDLRQLDDLLARTPLALSAWDKDLRASYWSRRAQEMFGYAPEDVIGKTVEEFGFVAPEDAEIVRHTQTHLDDIEVRSLININGNFRKDGSRRTCRWTTFAVQEDDRYHVLSYTEDITNSVAAQMALSESEERFRSLFEHNPDIIMVFAPDGIVVDVNRAISRIGGAEPEQIIGRHFSVFLDAEDVPKHQAYLERAMTGEMLNYRARALSLTGRMLDVTITTVPVFRDGKIKGAFSIIRDETEQRAAREQIEQQQTALADSEARLRSLFEHNPDAVISIAPDGTITDANAAAVALAGYPRAAIVGQAYQAFLSTASVESAERIFRQALHGEPGSLRIESSTLDGTPLAIDATLIPQFESGDIVGVYSVAQDITERIEAERRVELASEHIRNLYFIAAGGDFPDARMRASLEMGARVFDVTVGAVVDTTGKEPVIEAIFRTGTQNVRDERLVEIAQSVSSQPGVPLPTFFHDAVARRLEIGGEPYGALVFACESGPIREITAIDTDLLGLIATLIAGTIERNRQRKQLRAMAYFDVLTGLPNRIYLAEKLRDAIEVAQSRLGRVAVLFLDLDRFKDVNDTLGHARGDRLLKMVAERLVSELGPEMTIARMGGDEFVVLLTPAGDADQTRDMAERVLATISEPFALDEYEQFVSASIGIAVYPEDGRDDQTLIKNADIAMYRAKDRGRNGCYFYNATLEAPIHMRLSQEKLLRRALELDEFVVYYQPQLDLRTREVVSVEALVRWNHPKSGLIEPSHFIPSAEISGLIVPLGDWVLETAAKQVQAWMPTLGPLRLAVNLSARQFHQRDLRRRVIAAIDAAKLDPQQLEVEITETVAMSDAAQTVGIVRDLKASGIRTAVDDFGTGYSSLAYLRRFSLDALKIDGSFIIGVGHEVFDETIVKTVIGMAHSLGLEVVAEGVETDLQWRFLAENQCDLIQGYVLSRPLPAREFEEFCHEHRHRPRPDLASGLVSPQ